MILLSPFEILVSFYDNKLLFISIVLVLVFKFISDFLIEKRLNIDLDSAKSKAFILFDDLYVNKLKKIRQSHESLEEKSKQLETLIEESKDILKISNLLNFYNEQIKIYQKKTQNRASWSFTFAIIAMFSGLFFIISGSVMIINRTSTEEIVALTSLSTFGGAVSGYITKTFLDVHKTSLNQLNRYFKEPLINQYIIKSQLIAEELDSSERKVLLSKLFTITNEIIIKNSDFN